MFVSYVFPFTSPSNPGFWKKILVKTLFQVIKKNASSSTINDPKTILHLSRLFQAQCLFLPSHGFSARVSGSRQPNQTALHCNELKYNTIFLCPVLSYTSILNTILHINALQFFVLHYMAIYCPVPHHIMSILVRIDKKGRLIHGTLCSRITYREKLGLLFKQCCHLRTQ